MNKRILLIAIAVLVLAAAAVWFFFLREPAGIRIQTVKVVRTIALDCTAFTEGLYFQDGHFFESTGGVEPGQSGFRRCNPANGQITQRAELAAPQFGEGIVGWKDRIYQLTWRGGTGYIFNARDFTEQSTFTYSGEGWGLTQDGTHVIMSDGTSTLRFLNPETMATVSTLAVTANGCPVSQLNELEWVDGEIYANIWKTDLIARIDPKTGHVLGFLDVTALGPPNPGIDDVPNGIAWDAGSRRLFVTGKNWPQLYEVTAGDDVASAKAEELMTCAR
jgi:glutaminyl-peptide cyclotransferase